MHTAVLALLLAAVLSLLSPALQARVRARLQARPTLLFAVPTLLSALFLALAAAAQAFSLPLALMILAYTLAPTLIAYLHGPDLAVIAALWLPLEFSVGGSLIPRPAQGFLHSVAYGVAILLGLILFLCFRNLSGMKYRLPAPRDLAYGVAGFAGAAPILVVLGRAIDFIPAFHTPAHPAPGTLAAQFLAIFAGTALPEEILFRSLIQNWFMQRYGFHTRMLLLSAFIFGCAHLDNGPQPLPNWRYMILATIAGVVYGKVFQNSESVFSSVTCHALVDATKHFFF